jgi:hypothetical protein
MDKYEQLDKVFPTHHGRLPDFDAVLRDRDAKKARIKEQQFTAAKEHGELSRTDSETVDRLRGFEIRHAAKLEDDLKKSLDAIKADEVSASEVPKQGEYETGSEYQTRIAKHTVKEMRDLKRTFIAGYDLQIVSTVNDPALIQARVDDALATYTPEIAERILIVAASRLMPMAAAETNQPGATSATSTALLYVQSRLDQLRRGMAAKSPAGRRETARVEYELRKLNLHNGVENTLQLFGLAENNFVSGGRLTAVSS